MNEAVSDAQLAREACAWETRYECGGITEEDRIEFLRWLQRSPRHVKAYLQHVQMMQLLPEAVAGLRRAESAKWTRTDHGSWWPALRWVAASLGVLLLGYWAAQPFGTHSVSQVHASQELIFADRPLGEVAEELNHHFRVPVVIEDRALRHVRISGAFSADDREAFLRFLRELGGMEIEKVREGIRVEL